MISSSCSEDKEEVSEELTSLHSLRYLISYIVYNKKFCEELIRLLSVSNLFEALEPNLM
jgi:hypothetical protein